MDRQFTLPTSPEPDFVLTTERQERDQMSFTEASRAESEAIEAALPFIRFWMQEIPILIECENQKFAAGDKHVFIEEFRASKLYMSNKKMKKRIVSAVRKKACNMAYEVYTSKPYNLSDITNDPSGLISKHSFSALINNVKESYMIIDFMIIAAAYEFLTSSYKALNSSEQTS